MKIVQNNCIKENTFRILILFCLAVLIAGSAACGNSTSLQKKANDETDSNAPQMTDLERDIKSMKTADFQYIYVFRRKDGGAFDGDDKTFLRENRPPETNRFTLTDDEKAFVAGSNFEFPEEKMQILTKRFDIEDLSVPQSEKTDENKEIQKNNNNGTNKIEKNIDPASK